MPYFCSSIDGLLSTYFRQAQLSDSLMTVKYSLRRMLDAKILSRAVQRAEAERYAAERKLLEREKGISRLRLYVVMGTLLFAMATGALLFNRFRMRKQRQAELAEKERELLAAEKGRAEESLKHAEDLLGAYLNTIKEKTALAESLGTELEHLKKASHTTNGFEGVAANMEKLIYSTILTDEDWRAFRQLFEQVHPGFLHSIKQKFPDLSDAELRLSMLTKLKLPSREMAHMPGISIDAIRKSRYRVRKKRNLEPETDLEAAFAEL